LHSRPAGQSASVAHIDGGNGMHAPSTQTGAIAGQSASVPQPPGTTHIRDWQTMPGKGHSSSREQTNGGKQREEMQRQPVAHSESTLQLVGWQDPKSQRSPAAHSVSEVQPRSTQRKPSQR